MEISVDILKEFYDIKIGNIYGGKIFAKDASAHKAVVFYVSEDKRWVYSFCITSKAKTIKYFSRVDTEEAAVLLPKDLVYSLYGNEEKSWIYCGISNISKIDVQEFYHKLASKEITYYDKVSKELFSAIRNAILASTTYSEENLKELGIKS